jgi:hypothetical protein
VRLDVQVVLDVWPGMHALQRLTVEASIAEVDVSASPWQVSDMLRLAAAAAWLQRRALYAHLRPANLDALLGIHSGRGAVDSGESADGEAQWAARHGASARDAALPAWSDVWRFATLAIRSDLRLCDAAARARAARAQRSTARYREYVGACALLYAARACAIARGLDVKKARGADDGVSGEARAAQAFVDHHAVDHDFFSWVLHHVGHEAHSGAAGDSSAAAGPGEISVGVLRAARAAAALACHVPLSNAPTEDVTRTPCIAVRMATPAAQRSESPRSAAETPAEQGADTSNCTSVDASARGLDFQASLNPVTKPQVEELLISLEDLATVRAPHVAAPLLQDVPIIVEKLPVPAKLHPECCKAAQHRVRMS